MRFRMLPANGVPVSFIDLIKTYLIYLFTKKYNEFSSSFSEKVNQKYCYFLNSGRSALYIALKSLSGLRPEKNEVLMPEITCESVYYSISKSGLKPVFYKLREKTYEPDFNDIENKITYKSLCVIASPLFGISLNTNEFKNISKRKNVFLLADCAQTLGTKHENKDLGYYGDLSIYSFGKSKSITTIDGGALTTNNEIINESITKEYNALPDNGISESIKLILLFLINYIVIKPFFFNLMVLSKIKFANTDFDDKFPIIKMGNFQKSAGTIMLRQLERLNELRRRNSVYLIDKISQDDYAFPFSKQEENIFLRLPVLYKGKRNIKDIIAKFKSFGIFAGISTYKDIKSVEKPDKNGISELTILIPTHPYMRRSNLSKILEVINYND